METENMIKIYLTNINRPKGKIGWNTERNALYQMAKSKAQTHHTNDLNRTNLELRDFVLFTVDLRIMYKSDNALLKRA